MNIIIDDSEEGRLDSHTGVYCVCVRVCGVWECMCVGMCLPGSGFICCRQLCTIMCYHDNEETSLHLPISTFKYTS